MKKILLIILLFMIVTGFRLPGMDPKRSLTQTLNQVQENEIENSRDYSGERAASINKKPWTQKNLHNMEVNAWPDFGGRNYVDDRFIVPDADGTIDWDRILSGGCAFYQPNITSDCDSPYDVRMGIIRGVLVDWNISGQGSGDVKSGTGNMVFTVIPFENASYGDEIIVEAFTKTIETGEDGYCRAIVQLLCEDVGDCECIGGEPIIHGDEIIIAGETSELYVDAIADTTGSCPPYTWSTSSTGYSLSPSETGDGEIVTLSCVAGSCGANFDPFAVVNVVDSCGETYEAVVRNDAGSWGSPVATGTSCHDTFLQTQFSQIITCVTCEIEEISGSARWITEGFACGFINWCYISDEPPSISPDIWWWSTGSGGSACDGGPDGPNLLAVYPPQGAPPDYGGKVNTEQYTWSCP